jgi:pSer/pThr/pTyr-binding forkhead associated (FHA) protein/tetratricopeptide (TPR) repeat protein
VNLDVLKNDEVLASFDFSTEITGEQDQRFSALIGRAENCYIQINDRLVSREQASIGFENGQWFYENLSEFKPTFDEKDNEIKKIEFATNKKLRVGGYILSFKFNEEHSHATLDKTKTKVSTDKSNSTLQRSVSPEESQGDVISSDTEISNAEIEDGFSDEVDEQSFSENEPGGEYSDESEYADTEQGDYSSDDEFSSEDSFEQTDDFQEDNDEFAMEEAGEKTQVFSGHVNFYVEIFGEHAPYEKYTIKDGDNIIGRDEENSQIPLLDHEVSSKHANLKKVKGKIYLIDLDSANGTLLNGVKINEETLKDSDEFIIGSTTFTFRAKNDFLSAESDRFLPVEENQVIEVQEVVEVDELDISDSDSASEMPEDAQKSIVKKLIWKYKQLPRNKQIIYGIVGLFAIYTLLESDDPPKKVAGKKPGKEKIVNGKVVKEGGPDKKKPQTKAEQLFNTLSPEDQQFVISTYQLGFEFIQQAKYEDALRELDKVQKLIPKYKDTESLIQVASSGFRELEELEKKRLAEIEEKKRQEKINSLVNKARGYVKEKSVAPAESTFSQILAIDPENLDVPSLRMELDAWKKEKERKALEKAQKESERKRKLGQIAPSRTFYGKEEWYKTILKVEEFLRIKDMDEDLVKEATEMLKTSKGKLKEKTGPLLGKARSLKEGQDLKLSYEEYLKVLDHDPINREALDEMNEIRDTLSARSQNIYREGIIWESLQLWNEAKEKFQEVQQISPKDSEYYKKASLKLKDYLE